ncbi:MAG: tyrosine-type recombinase/integrase [Candidatus Peribacteraceae bacterium]|nr:tyrosine-type recombinase/integrase [Candidatus Peribacteraceae bacterium]
MQNQIVAVEKAPEKVLTEDEVNKMFEVVEGDIRLEVILRVLWQTGVRNTELRLLQTADVDDKKQRITFISLKKRSLKNINDLPRKTIPINNDLNKKLKIYRSYFTPKKYFFYPLRSRNFKNGVLGNKNKPLTQQGLEYIINQIAVKADVQETHIIHKRTEDNKGRPIEIKRGPTLTMKKVTVHTLRHSSATHIMRKSRDLELTRNILDHTSISSTQKYLHYNIQDKEEKLKGIFD